MNNTHLHDIARRRAHELRDEAIDRAWRAAVRFAARLARHQRLRGASVRAAAVQPAEVPRVHRCSA
jgi:hypothetical protein